MGSPKMNLGIIDSISTCLGLFLDAKAFTLAFEAPTYIIVPGSRNTKVGQVTAHPVLGLVVVDMPALCMRSGIAGVCRQLHKRLPALLNLQ